MINGLKNKEIITEKQQKIRNKELIGIPLNEIEKGIMRLKFPYLEGVVPMKNTTKYHDRITTPPPYIDDPNDIDEEVDLEEILREMGYGDEEDTEMTTYLMRDLYDEVEDEWDLDEVLREMGLEIQ